MVLTKQDKEALFQIKQLIEKDYKTHYSIEYLAQAAFMSRSKLIKAYKVFFGMALYEHLQNYRLILGKKLLEDEALSIKEVAYQCGYKYPCNFSTAFKRKFGVSPEAYRRL